MLLENIYQLTTHININMKIVLVTGGFDPLHSGHIEYFEAAKRLGDYLIVGVNSDVWLERKKGKAFMPIEERKSIIEMLKIVDEVITFDDSDNTAIDAINEVKKTWNHQPIIFANGGDRTKHNIPEMLSHTDVEYVFGVGGTDKKNSSSWILEEWKSPKTIRNWGWYRVLDKQPGYKVKELVIEPGKSLSMQRHFNRSEHWYVLKGGCSLTTEYKGETKYKTLSQFSGGYVINKEVWHQGSNPHDEYCHILEVQYGEECIEEDIERKSND